MPSPKLLFKNSWFLIFSVVTILFNRFQPFFELRGTTIGEDADRFITPVLPAGYAFSIWGLIFLSWIVIGVFILQQRIKISKQTLIWFGLSCLLNMSWSYFSAYNIFSGSMFFLFLILITALGTTASITKDNEPSKLLTFTRSSLLIYAGWLIAASIIGVTIWLKYDFNFNLGIDENIWAVAILTVGLIINFLFSLRAKNATTLFVFAWALVGIYVKQPSQITQTGSLILAVIALLTLRF